MGDETSLRDDISFLRQMAESGRKGPIIGGSFLAAAGVVFGIVSFLQWGAITGRLAIADRQMQWIWGAGYIVFAIIWFALWAGLRARRRSASSSSSNAAFGIAWIANAVGVTMAYGTTAIAVEITHMPDLFYAFIPVIFIFYGISWGLSATMARRRWMYLPAIASFAFALAMARFTNDPAQMAVMGLGLLLLLTVPGIKLAMDETRS